MPSRLVTSAIVLFWAATTGWLLSREVLPFLGIGAAPAYTINITEQIGASPVRWIVLSKGVKVGEGTSQIRRAPGRTFDIETDFKFDRLTVYFISVGKVASIYRVSEEGELVSLSGEITGDFGPPKSPPSTAGKVEFQATVADGYLVPAFRASYLGMELPGLDMEKAPLAEHGNLLNPMHPLNRLSGLHEGQRWRVPLFNPLSALAGQLRKQIPGGLAVPEVTMPLLQAEVAADTLVWNDGPVACYKIEYREPGKAVAARTWVRRFDGLVLEQWAVNAGLEIALVRVPEK